MVTTGQMVRFARHVNALLAVLAAIGIVMTFTPTVGAQPGEARPVRVVALGDSLTAGFGLQPHEAFPAQLERRLKALGHDVVIANAGVSGDTTSAGLARVDWAVPEGTDAVILELGANDALSGRPPHAARANLLAIITKLKARNIEVLLTGMRAPRNLGNDYANAFDSMFPELAAQHGLILYPFFLTGVALDPKLNLNDGIHPNAKGIAIIAERMVPSAEELIERVKAKRGTPRPKG
ncbi:MAG: arylesterase [Hyphomicrobiaceae bacterium]